MVAPSFFSFMVTSAESLDWYADLQTCRLTTLTSSKIDRSLTIRKKTNAVLRRATWWAHQANSVLDTKEHDKHKHNWEGMSRLTRQTSRNAIID